MYVTRDLHGMFSIENMECNIIVPLHNNTKEVTSFTLDHQFVLEEIISI